MRLSHFPLAFLCVAHIAISTASAQQPGGPVVIGEMVRLESKLLKEPRTLLIAKPAGYDGGAERYPVLYLLDAEVHFHYASGIEAFLAGIDRMPKMLVVGITGGDQAHRTRDLTPPSTAEMDNRFSPGGGGADAFLSFFTDELIPYVEKTYRTRPYRLLVGHSLGGLFAVYAMIKRPALFNGYIAADPSIYWNNQAVVAQAESFLVHRNSLQADFYLTVGGALGDIPEEVARFRTALAKSAPEGFRWSFDAMKDQDHMSIPLPGIYRGLEAIFEEWRLSNPLELFDKGGIEGIHKRYRDAGRRFGYPERTTPPLTVSLVVAALLSAGRLDEAASVLLHDPKTYPPPWNQLDALARRYESRGNTEKAVQYYLLSLKQNPQNEFAKKKLAEMGIKNP
jgi:uncharacterized protein